MQELLVATALLVAILAASILLWLASSTLRRRREREILARPFPQKWRDILETAVPMYSLLPAPLQNELHGRIHLFLEKTLFEGCGGLEVDDKVKVTIAAQACILLLNRRSPGYSKLRTVLVYPSTYVERNPETGAASVRLGESWTRGTVVLAWDSVLGGARNIRDGRNVTLHEFAHQLDQVDGLSDGTPILENRTCYASWAEVLGEEYERLQRRARRGRKSVMNHYGATNPAEFFAVATETFFEKPKTLARKRPELYEELKTYYQLDPLSWTAEGE